MEFSASTTLRKRKDGRWEAIISFIGPDGKPRRKSFYGKTQQDVRQKLTGARRTLDQGGALPLERQMVGQFLDRWLEDLARKKKAPKTYKSYAQIVRLYVKPVLGRHQLTGLGPQHVEAMLNHQLDQGLAPRTVQYTRAVLRIALNRALKWGLVARNVAALVDPPKVPRYQSRPLSPEQAGRLLEAARGDRLEALYAVGVALGLRPGELYGLRWEDVDFEARTIRAQKQPQVVDGELQLVGLKTGRSRRTLPMPAVIARQLRAHWARQMEERLLAGSRWQDWGLVFTSTIGTPLDNRNVNRRYKALLQKAGLPDVRHYDLRHSAASLLIAQGVPLSM